MNTATITPETLSNSVIAVPPLARDADLNVCATENAKIIQHLEAGGIRTLLYGGNAVFYHIALAEYAATLALLQEQAGANTTVVPSVGPAYGTSMDQASVLRDFDFPTVMVLPARDIATPKGCATGIRKFAEAYGKPIVLYIKFEGYLEPEDAQALVDDGVVNWIKYAIVRDDPTQDDYLSKLVNCVDPQIIVSGIGEQPAITHVNGFGVNSFTSGCVCVAPSLSMEMLAALKAGDLETAERIRQTFEPLEDLRNSINPIRVLHTAVAEAGIAETGPILPLLHGVCDNGTAKIAAAAKELLGHN
ncbi:MAG: dihydrodipicolinate synthase family protein [Verrucomicrobiales bacterium]|nr:dihydrodipicolinate synthase family protein [Verrucomicrobiales bacterium]|tara:strand:+ start:11534 stop:12445 length:912 start_codon:yes stop_codon:yes gene_type:complete